MAADETPNGVLPLALVLQMSGAALLLNGLGLIPGFFDGANSPAGMIAMAGVTFLAAGSLLALRDYRLSVFFESLWYRAMRLGLELLLLAGMGAVFVWAGTSAGEWAYILPGLLVGFIILVHAGRGIRALWHRESDGANSPFTRTDD